MESTEVLEHIEKTKLIDRTRRISQHDIIDYNSMAHPPVARIGHSYITAYFADAITSQLGLYGYIKKLILLYAFLHDVGHPPFSHSIESYLKELTGKDHEQMALERLPEVKEEIESMNLQFEDARRIFSGESPYKQIVSNAIGADKLAYTYFDSMWFRTIENQITPLKHSKYLEEDVWALVKHMFFDEEGGKTRH